MVAKLKQSYSKPEEIEGFDELKEAEQEKVRRAWDDGAIPEDDKGPGEPVASEKKKPAKRAKKSDDGDGEKPAKKRARKAVRSLVFFPDVMANSDFRRMKTTMRKKRSLSRSGLRRLRYVSTLAV